MVSDHSALQKKSMFRQMSKFSMYRNGKILLTCTCLLCYISLIFILFDGTDAYVTPKKGLKGGYPCVVKTSLDSVGSKLL